MDSQGTTRDASGCNPNGATGGIPPPVMPEFRSQRPGMTPPPFFQGFSPLPNQMPFLFPHSFMPHVGGMGFPPPAQGSPSATIDLSEVSQKRGPQECIPDQSKSAKKRRGPKKKPEIIELDEAKDEVELQKHVGHWKDHWVIQLITIRGEMRNTFSAPPKQGILRSFFPWGLNVYCMGGFRLCSSSIHPSAALTCTFRVECERSEKVTEFYHRGF